MHTGIRFGRLRLVRVALKIGRVALAVMAMVKPFLFAQVKPPPFQPGEQLTYDVTWSIFRAGTVSAVVERGGQRAEGDDRIITTAHSQGVVSSLFKLRDEFHSFFDPHTMCSQKILKTINEGRRHKQIQIVFDSQRLKAILDEHDLAKAQDQPKHAENDIPPCVEDVITAFYYLRLQDLQIGKPLRLPVNDGSKTYDVTLEVQVKETIRIPLGSRAAIRVEPKVFNGLFKRKGRMLVWFSDDEQHLPLRIRFIVAVGRITATLRSVGLVDATAPTQEQPGPAQNERGTDAIFHAPAGISHF